MVSLTDFFDLPKKIKLSKMRIICYL
jgi:hypothetical protein